jgi:RNA polymerase sigma factor (sigma-70 family)
MEITEELIRQCRRQNKTAEKQLFSLLYAPMYRLCRRYTGHHEEAEDCLMKGFIQLFRNLESFRYSSAGAFMSWVKKIMVNEALACLRRQTPVWLHSGEEAEAVTIEPAVLEKLDAEELNRLIGSLPDGYRVVFNLYIIEGYSHAEIAGMLGITEVTSRTQLAKAKARLKALLEQQNPVYAQH